MKHTALTTAIAFELLAGCVSNNATAFPTPKQMFLPYG